MSKRSKKYNVSAAAGNTSENNNNANIQLTRQVKTYRDKNMELEKEINSLRKNRVRSDLELSDLRKARDKSDNKISELEKKNTELSHRIDLEKQINTDTAKTLRELKTTNQSFSENLDKHRDARDDLQIKLQLSSAKVESLSNQVEALENRLEETQCHNSSILQRNTSLSAELDTLLSKNTELKTTIDKSESDNAALLQTQAELAQANVELQAKTLQIAGLTERSNELSKEHATLCIELKQSQEEVSTLSKTVASSTLAHKKTLRELETVKSSLESTANTSSKYHARLKTIDSESKSSKLKVKELEEKLERLQRGYDTEVANKFSEKRGRQVLASKVKALTSRQSYLQEQLRASDDVRRYREAQLKRLVEAIPFLLQKLDSLSSSSTGPYSTDLLSGYIGMDKTVDVSITNAKKNSFAPFVIKEEEDLLTLAPATDVDVNGLAFLDRSKINIYLNFCQSRSGIRKQKSLLITKVGELLSQQRQLLSDSALERARLNSSNAILSNELEAARENVSELQAHIDGTDMGRKTLLDRYVKLLLTEEDQRNCEINLSECGITDEDLQHVVSTMLSSSVTVWVEGLNLDGNDISDTGARVLTSLISTSMSLKWIHLNNNAISWDGINALATMCHSNPRVETVRLNPSSFLIEGRKASSEEHEIAMFMTVKSAHAIEGRNKHLMDSSVKSSIESIEDVIGAERQRKLQEVRRKNQRTNPSLPEESGSTTKRSHVASSINKQRGKKEGTQQRQSSHVNRVRKLANNNNL